ncbi:lipocalin-like [Polypterus senegalus]|uniref:lipocalin-like n=1 Tax=Polypterus senegalus TaxID=55291 RepID=UPI001962ACD1|nr:lipocalin-like [Polypterus senegalus]
MKMFLLAAVATVLLCVSPVRTADPQLPDFDIQRFAGKWHWLGVASDASWFIQHRDKFKACVGVLTPMDNGDVNVTVWKVRSSECKRYSYLYEKTDTPNHFTYVSHRFHNSVNNVVVLDTDYESYAVVSKRKTHKDKDHNSMNLYVRSERLTPDLKLIFREAVLTKGLPEESIFYPPVAEDCPPVDV